MKVQCEVCKGIGREQMNTRRPDGKGWVERPCGDCNGQGYIEVCEHCGREARLVNGICSRCEGAIAREMSRAFVGVGA